MTIPQAITLITLRLGALESKLMQLPEGGTSINIDGDSGIDNVFLQNIVSRLESLEKRISTQNGSVSSPDLNLLKQQFETVKQTVVQGKGTSNTMVKEITGLKTNISNLSKELTETKELVTALQNITMDNSKKLLELSMSDDIDYNNVFDENNINNFQTLDENLTEENLTDLQDDGEQNDIIGTDLKLLIESELNTAT